MTIMKTRITGHPDSIYNMRRTALAAWILAREERIARTMGRTPAPTDTTTLPLQKMRAMAANLLNIG